jgi:hypothetical protein
VDFWWLPFRLHAQKKRIASGDPRSSLEERYVTHDAYVVRVREAARRMVEQRFVLQEDADRIVRETEDSAVLT